MPLKQHSLLHALPLLLLAKQGQPALLLGRERGQWPRWHRHSPTCRQDDDPPRLPGHWRLRLLREPASLILFVLLLLPEACRILFLLPA
ncbi:hypothetical protein AYO44_05570 [Planctomycetaceae bacterium SCGC AG-212-F19]|nr:hypothetical protein AYO44_05570 [Planctomycetaceae bacterium SCGC AG-212-F19]